MAATGMMKADGGGASPVSRSALKDGPPAGTENGQQTDGTDVPAARLLVEKNKVAGPADPGRGPVEQHFAEG